MGDLENKREDHLVAHPSRLAARGALRVTALALALLTIGAICASYHFGSFAAALGYLEGDRLLVADPFKSIGEVPSGSKHLVSFSVRNYSGRPVRILGVKSSCSCTTIEDLPRTLNAGQTMTVPVTVDLPRSGETFLGHIEIFTDYPEQAAVLLRIRARLIAPKAFQVNLLPLGAGLVCWSLGSIEHRSSI
jgi:hypothetical protein